MKTKLIQILSGVNRVIRGLASLAWLLIFGALAALVIDFYAALIIPSLGISFIMDYLGWTIAGVYVAAIGAAIISKRVGWLCTRDAAPFYRWTSVGILTMVALFYAIENWRGKQQWSSVLQEMAARGEKSALMEIIPGPVSQDQDAAKTEIFAPLSNFTPALDGNFQFADQRGLKRLTSMFITYKATQRIREPEEALWLRQERIDFHRVGIAMAQAAAKATKTSVTVEAAADILQAHLDKCKDDLEAVIQASHKPYARFKMTYEFGILGSANHRFAFENLIKVFMLKSVFELKQGKPDLALEDVRCMIRLCNLMSQQPFVGGFQGNAVLIMNSLQPVWEGLADHRWSSTHLETLQSDLNRINMLAEFKQWTRISTWQFMDFVDQICPVNSSVGTVFDNLESADSRTLLTLFRLIYPNGWSYQNQASFYRQYQNMTTRVNVESMTIDPDLFSGLAKLSTLDPFYAVFIAPKFRQMIHGEPGDAALSQTSVHLARLACAIERYRLAEGKLPTSLESLKPRYIENIPVDVISGKPLCYHPGEGDKYALYSVGWNQRDDGGNTSLESNTKNPRISSRDGDWVWTSPRTNSQTAEIRLPR